MDNLKLCPISKLSAEISSKYNNNLKYYLLLWLKGLNNHLNNNVYAFVLSIWSFSNKYWIFSNIKVHWECDAWWSLHFLLFYSLQSSVFRDESICCQLGSSSPFYRTPAGVLILVSESAGASVWNGILTSALPGSK